MTTDTSWLTAPSTAAPLAHVLLIALGQSASDAYPKRTQCTWAEFVQWLYQHPRTAAGLSPTEYATLKAHPSKSPEGQRIHADKDGPYVAVADFNGNRRALETVVASYGVPLDFDAGWITADVIAATLHGYTYVAYTTYAHAPGAERWRVFVPVSAPMDAETHRATWAALSAMFGNAADIAAKDASRLSYLPGRCLYPEAARIFHADGTLLAPVQPAPAPPQELQALTDGPVPGWSGPTDDNELIAIACATKTRADERFGGVTHFAMLWTANEQWLSARYPPNASETGQTYSRTQADMALAGELAYWTGSDYGRMVRLMQASGLATARGHDADWMERKALRACERAVQNAKQWAFTRPIVPAGTKAVPPPCSALVTGIPKAQHLCTDQANAERLQRRYGDRLIACAGTFYTWDGKRWKADDGLAQRFACELSKMVHDEADAALAQAAAAQKAVSADNMRAHLQHPRLNPLDETADGAKLFELEEIAKALSKWSRDCEMKAKQDAALGLLKKLLAVDVNQLDADPWLLNCENGTVDLRTGQLREHRAADFITKLAPVTYDPAATAPRFHGFLDDIFVSDRRVIDFVQRWHGYAATGSTREHYLVIHWGAGSNGKSTLIKAVESVLGDYATAAPTGLLTAKDGDGRHPAEIAKLQGRRLVTASESEDGAKLREAFVKQMTGGDTLTARRMYGDWFDFKPTHKLQLFTNSKPQIRGSDFGIWRRILLVPYTVKFGSADELAAGEVARLKDPTLGEALEQEKPGILNWLIEGARRWYADGGLQPPDVVLAASREYREEQDRLGEFIRDCCQLDQQARQPLPLLYQAYRSWCRESGIDHPFTRQRFVDELEQRVPGFQRPKKSHGTNYVRGIVLTSSLPVSLMQSAPPPPPSPMPAAPPAPPQMVG
jgi:P4 family phage/plasmid primase-like protien